jgi:hypothetical protein
LRNSQHRIWQVFRRTSQSRANLSTALEVVIDTRQILREGDANQSIQPTARELPKCQYQKHGPRFWSDGGLHRQVSALL